MAAGDCYPQRGTCHRVPLPPARGRALRGFTLIELLVVILIIGILASIGLPAMKGIGQANLTAAANRQILDDLNLARLKAINDRTTVYMVFIPPTVVNTMTDQIYTPERRHLTNLLSSQFIGYSMLSARTVGDQPGRATPRYLTTWKTLPEGMIFAPYKFNRLYTNHVDEYARTFSRYRLPFPNSRGPAFELPSIGFNSQGQLVSQRDEIIPLARGSVFFPRGPAGTLSFDQPDVQLTPPPKPNASPRTQTNSYQFVRINWLTGRAKMELPAFQ